MVYRSAISDRMTSERPIGEAVRQAAFVVAVALACGLLAYGSIALTKGTERFAAIWAINAIVVAIMMRRPDDPIAKWSIPVWIANAAANVWHGFGLWQSVIYASANLAEITAAVALLRAIGCKSPDFAKVSDLVRFIVVAGLIAPVLAASVSMLAVSSIDTSTTAINFLRWWATDALGMILIAPILLLLHAALPTFAQQVRAKSRDWAAIFILGTGVTVAVFAQTELPLLFLVIPVVIIHAFRLGVVGTACSILKISIIASIFTGLGYGPIQLVDGVTTQILVLQLFLATGFFVGLPVAIMLAERQATLRLLSDTQEQYRSLLENMGQAFFRIGGDGRWEFLNPAWQTLTLRSCESSLGQHYSDILSASDRSAIDASFQSLRNGSSEEATHCVGLSTHGEDRFFELRWKGLWDSEDCFSGAIGTIRDVSEQRIAETALRQSQRDFETLATITPVGIVRTTKDGAVTYCNPAWLNLAGLTQEEAREGGWANALHADDRERVWSDWHAAVASKAGYRTEFRFHGNHGSTWVDVIAEPEFSANGNVSGFVAVVVDISDRKSLHDALVRARRHAEAAALSKANFLANMSHEIRTPMNGVLGFADLLLECDLDGEARNFAEIIANSGKEMMRLLNDILDLSKIEAGEISLIDEMIDLRPMLKGCADLMSAEASAKGLLLDVQIFPSVPNDVLADRGRLRQIVLNLLGNAVKFTAQGSITLSARCVEGGGGRRLAIEIEDSSIGIAANKLHTIFEPFAQGDCSTSRQFGGTGLGLTICRQLARKMGGDISCESVLGQGSRFLLYLPLASAGNESSDRNGMVLGHAPAVATTERSLRILLAEDLSINQKLVQKILARDGHEVSIANNGHEAIAMVDAAHGANRNFDLVLMDVQMPGLDGLQATRAIRERGFGADILPIIALTANAFPEDIALCKAAGMQDHIEKPINRLALLKAVSSLAGKQQQPTQPSEMTDGFTLVDPDLRSDFDKRKRDLVHAIRQAFDGDHDLADYSDLLLAECHKMAGVAGLFGETWIGAMAAELERRLQQQQEGGPDSEIRKLASQLGAELDKAA